jgi:hypothetical protein
MPSTLQLLENVELKREAIADLEAQVAQVAGDILKDIAKAEAELKELESAARRQAELKHKSHENVLGRFLQLVCIKQEGKLNPAKVKEFLDFVAQPEMYAELLDEPKFIWQIRKRGKG